MDLLKPFKKVVSNMKDKIADNRKQELKKMADEVKLDMWKKRLTKALENHSEFRNNAADWDEQYRGSKKIDGKNGQAAKDATNTVRLTYQLIESEIQIDVPKPRVDPIEEDDGGDKQKMLFGLMTDIAEGPKLKKIVSENERINKKNSISFIKVSYNPDKKNHTRVGEITFSNPHPKNIVMQPGIYDIDEADYWFHIENRTIDHVCRRYGEEFRNEFSGKSAEFKFLEDLSDSTSEYDPSGEGWVSVVECWYRDKEGDVGLLTFANETILKDEQKFYYKRDENGQIQLTEKVLIDKIEYTVDPETGEAVPQVTGQEMVEVECYVPKSYPIVAWYNIPVEKQFHGISDCDVMRGQQMALNKAISKFEERLMNGNNLIVTETGSGLKNKITNATTQTVECDDPKNAVAVYNLTAPDGQMQFFYDLMTQAAKDAVGVTNAYTGNLDNGQAMSGKAIENLASNSTGRLMPKMFEKNIAFEKLYQIVYDFILAYYDDDIPFSVDGPNNKKEFGVFNKGKLVKKDRAGIYYYPNFKIYIDADTGMAKDTNFIMRSSLELVSGGAMDTVEFWTVMETIGYPNASMILEMEEKKMAQQQAMLLQQQQVQVEGQRIKQEKKQQMDMIKAMSPEDRKAFEQSSPEEQKMMMEAMIKQMQGNQV